MTLCLSSDKYGSGRGGGGGVCVCGCWGWVGGLSTCIRGTQSLSDTGTTQCPLPTKFSCDGKVGFNFNIAEAYLVNRWCTNGRRA